MNEPIVTLGTLAHGAGEELFSEELQKVLKNIADPNTDAKSAREITLKVRFTPNDDRTMGDTIVTCASKLAPFRKVHTVVYLGRRDGAFVAVESNPKQLAFDTAPVGPVPIEQGRKEMTDGR
jgi:hypothetical protein